MQGWGDVLIEMEYRTGSIEAELEQARVARLVAAATSRNQTGSRFRLVAAWVSDLFAGLRCQLERRFVSKPGAAAC